MEQRERIKTILVVSNPGFPNYSEHMTGSKLIGMWVRILMELRPVFGPVS